MLREENLQTSEIIQQLKALLLEIPQLKTVKEGFHNPHVKAWKTKLEGTLGEGGTTCSKALLAVRKMTMNLSGSELIKTQTYLSQLDAFQNTLQQIIQTLEVFGRPEKKKNLPQWATPKSVSRAVGHLMVGEEEVATDEISIHEVLACLISLAEDSNDLADSMRVAMIEHLQCIISDDLLQPFLSQRLDALLGHWPEFQTK